MMEPRPISSPFRPFLTAAISLFIIGWGTVAYAILGLSPTVWARWLLFFGATLGLIGMALPAAWYLNLRFPSDPPAGSNVIVRQATWVGVYGVVLAWLQQVRLVSVWTFLGLGFGLAAIEFLIRMREKARWQPKAIPKEKPPADSNPTSKA